MHNKYTIVQHEKRLFWLQKCPILLHSYAITKNNVDNSILLQCKFENIGDKTIKAVSIAIKCFDILHQPLTDVDDYSFLDINVQPYILFGDRTPIPLPDNATRNVLIVPLKIVFSDDTMWENTAQHKFELAEYQQQPISSIGALAEQYKRDLHKICKNSKAHSNLPVRVNGFTICGCGHVIKSSEKSCPVCNVDIEKLFQINNVDVLKNHFKDYQIEQKKNQQHTKEKKKKTIFRVAVVSSIAILAIAIPFTFSIINKNTFMDAFHKAQAYSDRFSACEDFAACVTDEGRVILTEPYEDITLNDNTENDIISVNVFSIKDGDYIYRKYEDGIVLSTELSTMTTDKYDKSEEEDDSNVISSVYAGKYGDVKLMKNGTISSKIKNTSQAKNIAYITTFGEDHNKIAALSTKGNVTLFGGYINSYYDVESWRNIIQISASEHNIVGLCRDGTVIATGSNTYGQCNVEDWYDIIAVKAMEDSIYGIKKDGTVIGVGYIPECGKYNLENLKLW